jgi:Rieske Fe-S protein
LAPEGSYRVEGRQVVLDVAAVDELQTVGDAVKLTVRRDASSGRKLIVLRVAENKFRAFRDVCTHNGKELNYLHDEAVLACCGLSSRFDLSGRVLEPLAEDPLTRYAVAMLGEELVIATQDAAERGQAWSDPSRHCPLSVRTQLRVLAGDDSPRR